jgi:hypothetical protein
MSRKADWQNPLTATKHKQQNGEIYENYKYADAAVADDYESDRRFECSGTNS